jgi:hypothetical protein
MKKVLSLALLAIVGGLSEARDFKFHNNCPYTIWPGVDCLCTLIVHSLTTVCLQIRHGWQKPALANGGFELSSGNMTVISAPNDWAGTFWARTQCRFDQDAPQCVTGDCGNGLECSGAAGRPPITLVEFTLQGPSGVDFYDG